MTKTAFALRSVVIFALAAFVAGVAVGSLLLAGVGRTPCGEVRAGLQGASDSLSATFGSGDEGAAALSTLRAAAGDRPDCFTQAEREFFDVQPSDAGNDSATEVPSS